MEMFPGVIGHQRVLSVLRRMVENDSLPHAFLFLGSEGVGRTHVAEKLLLQLFPEAQALETVPDLVRVVREEDQKTGKAKTQIGVEQIRSFTTRISMSAIGGGWKAGIIEEADRLSVGAANALLKTLEEPKGKTMMILRAPDIESVLPTIASRCQVIRFQSVGDELLLEGLVKMGYSRADVAPIVERSFGRPGIAVRLMKDSAFRAEHETGRASIERAFEADIPSRLKLATDLVPKSEVNKRALLESLLDRSEELLRQRLHTQLESQPQNLSHTVFALERLTDVRASTRNNINPHLALEHLFLSV